MTKGRSTRGCRHGPDSWAPSCSRCSRRATPRQARSRPSCRAATGTRLGRPRSARPSRSTGPAPGSAHAAGCGFGRPRRRRRRSGAAARRAAPPLEGRLPLLGRGARGRRCTTRTRTGRPRPTIPPIRRIQPRLRVVACASRRRTALPGWRSARFPRRRGRVGAPRRARVSRRSRTRARSPRSRSSRCARETPPPWRFSGGARCSRCTSPAAVTATR